MQEGYEFKVIITNKTGAAGKVAHFHEGRGYQEKIYAELKNHARDGLCSRPTVGRQKGLSALFDFRP